MSDGLDRPRLGLNEEPEEERREDVWETDPESLSEPEPEPEAEAAPDAEPDPDPDPDPDREEAEDVPAEEDELPSLRGPEHAAGELQIPDGYGVIEGEPTGNRRAVGIVVARFNGELTGELLRRALDELERLGVGREAVTVIPVPGAFELPLAAMALAKTRRYSCIVALGAVIRGETPHFEYVASEAASGLQLAGLETGVPVAFGVLTTEDEEQARARLDKGAEAVRTALEMADVFSQLRAAAGAASP
jgi:6,7-dimethyl-8-ribityllumazine synthase